MVFILLLFLFIHLLLLHIVILSIKTDSAPSRHAKITKKIKSYHYDMNFLALTRIFAPETKPQTKWKK
jgi:hypothetical protein